MYQKANPGIKTTQDSPNLRQPCPKQLQNHSQTIENQAKVIDCWSFSYFSLLSTDPQKIHQKAFKIAQTSFQKQNKLTKLAILAASWRLLGATCYQLGPFCSILLTSFSENSNRIVLWTPKSPQDPSRPRFSSISDPSRIHFH